MPPSLSSARLRREAAIAAGLPCVKAVTVPLTAGPIVVGFVTIFFSSFGAKSDRDGLASLREVCDAIGGAVFVRRAFALNQGPSKVPDEPARPPQDSAAEEEGAPAAASVPPRSSSARASIDLGRLRAAASGPLPAPRPSDSASRRRSFISCARVSSGELHTGRPLPEGPARAAAAAPGPTGNPLMTRKRPTEAVPEDEVLEHLGSADDLAADGPDLASDDEAAAQRLLDWDFDAWHASDRDVKALAFQMFNTLQLVDRFGLVPDALRAFVDAVAEHMRDNPFHCFRRGSLGLICAVARGPGARPARDTGSARPAVLPVFAQALLHGGARRVALPREERPPGEPAPRHRRAGAAPSVFSHPPCAPEPFCGP